MRRLALIATLVIAARAGSEGCYEGRDAGFKCATASPSQQFYYDQITGVCQPFYYRGCGGTNNIFASKASCVSKCGGGAKNQANQGEQGENTVVEVCSLPTDAKLNDQARRCSRAKDCDEGWQCSSGFCCPSKDHVCNLPANQGTQLNGQVSKQQKFVWLRGINNCLPFSYFGIDGNFNNFPSQAACIAFCKP